MKIRKPHAAWAVKIWVLLSVFLIPFLSGWAIGGWLALGGFLALVWHRLPDEAEAPVDPLPFAHEYEGRQVPRRGVVGDAPPPRPSPKGEGES